MIFFYQKTLKVKNTDEKNKQMKKCYMRQMNYLNLKSTLCLHVIKAGN